MSTNGSEPKDVAVAFFDAYRDHDIETMVDLCAENADFRYIPAEGWMKQRVVRGKGKVSGVGKTYWTALIDAFPDLTNEVTSVSQDEDGNVACEVVIGGTQEKAFNAIGCAGKRYWLPHLFFLHVNEEGLIDDIAGYWDGAEWYRQLGHVEVD